MSEKTFWIVGGACSGKTSLAAALCTSTGHTLIDMDERIYGSWLSSYSEQKTPENYRWIKQSNPLEWALEQSDEGYLRHCAEVSREYFQLLLLELSQVDRRQASLVDGGFSSLVPWIDALQNPTILCLDVDRDLAVSEWNSHPDRVGFKHEILALPDGEKKWLRFLELDALITTQLVKQARAHDVPVIHSRQSENMETVVQHVVERFGLISD